jgi:hypothetical protein
MRHPKELVDIDYEQHQRDQWQQFVERYTRLRVSW